MVSLHQFNCFNCFYSIVVAIVVVFIVVVDVVVGTFGHVLTGQQFESSQPGTSYLTFTFCRNLIPLKKVWTH